MPKANVNQKTLNLVMLAIFTAIIIVMTFTPYIGYISYGVISITTIHIPVFIGAVLLGFKGGAILGTVWGVTCLLNAFFINPIEGAIFLNPLISVVPRILVGLIVGLIAAAFLKKDKPVVAAIVCALAGTLSNTILVLTAISLFGSNQVVAIGDTLLTIYKTVFSINGAIELIAALVLVPVISKPLLKVRGQA